MPSVSGLRKVDRPNRTSWWLRGTVLGLGTVGRKKYMSLLRANYSSHLFSITSSELAFLEVVL